VVKVVSKFASHKLAMNGRAAWRPLGSLVPSISPNTKSVRRTQPLNELSLRRNRPQKSRNGRAGLARSRATAAKLRGGRSAAAFRTGVARAARSRAAAKVRSGTRPAALRTRAANSNGARKSELKSKICISPCEEDGEVNRACGASMFSTRGSKSSVRRLCVFRDNHNNSNSNDYNEDFENKLSA
jgi:hypothetical protein